MPVTSSQGTKGGFLTPAGVTGGPGTESDDGNGYIALSRLHGFMFWKRHFSVWSIWFKLKTKTFTKGLKRNTVHKARVAHNQEILSAQVEGYLVDVTTSAYSYATKTCMHAKKSAVDRISPQIGSADMMSKISREMRSRQKRTLYDHISLFIIDVSNSSN